MKSILARTFVSFAVVATVLAGAGAEAAVVTEEVAYEHDGVSLTGYLAWDDAREGQRPGVLVVHEWWGPNDYPRMRARMLAEMGYTALALDMYGDGKLAEHPQDAQTFMMEVLGNIEAGEGRFRAARRLLEEHPTTDPAKTAAIGYCFGGATVLHMARAGEDLDAVASFHGDLSTQSPAAPGSIQARVLVLHGAADPFVPAEAVAGFEREMTDAGADFEVIQYEGAQHSFTNPGATAVGEEFGMPLVYDEGADRESWEALDAFLADVFSD